MNEQEYLKRLHDDIIFFCQQILEFTPYQYQRDMLTTPSNRIVACWGRQTGKTTTIAAKVIHYAFTHPNSNILIISKGLRQSMLMYAIISKMVNDAPLLASSVTRVTYTQMWLSNGSTILALPCVMPNARIMTSKGIKQAKDITENDLLLTHNGNYKRILQTFKTPYEGTTVTFKIGEPNKRCERSLTTTPEHPIYATINGELNWYPAYQLKEALKQNKEVQFNTLRRKLTGTPKQIPETDKAYYASFIDGEGWLNLQIKSQNGRFIVSPQIGITQDINRHAILDQFKQTFGGEYHYSKKKHSARVVVTGKQNVLNLLATVKPYLRLKRELADILERVSSFDWGSDTASPYQLLKTMEYKEQIHRINLRNNPKKLAKTLANLERYRQTAKQLKQTVTVTTQKYRGYVYNWEVEDDNSYVVSSFIVHNCGVNGANLRGHTADMVIMDEAAFMNDTVITQVIFPMIACHVSDTQFLLPDGQTVTAKTLYTQKMPYIIGTEKDTYNRNEVVEFIPVKIKEYIDNGEHPCLTITTKNGRETTVTRNHPFPTIHSNSRPWLKNIEWRTAETLQVGDYIAVPSVTPFFGSTVVDEWEAKFLGYMIADGCMSQDQCIWSKTEKNVIKDMQQIVEAMNYHLKPFGHQQYVIVNNEGKHTKNMFISLLKQYKLWGCTSKTKNIPTVVYNWNKQSIKTLLKALFTGDSSIDEKYGSIRYSTVSLQLAKQVKHLLLRFGVDTTKISTTKKGLYWFSISDTKTFFEEIGYHNRTPTKLSNGRYKKNAHITWRRITSIKDAGTQHTYGFTTQGQTMIADDLWTHNTKGQNGIAIMLSTPWGRDSCFFRAFVDPRYWKQRVKSSDCPVITKDFLDEQHHLIGDLRFRIEYEAEFIEDATCLFTQDMIAKCIKKWKPTDKLITDEEIMGYTTRIDGTYVLGADLGKRMDYSSVQLYRREHIEILSEATGRPEKLWTWRLVYIKTFPLKTPLNIVMNHIAWLNEKFTIKAGCIDQTGIGDAPVEELSLRIRAIEGIPMYSAQAKHSVAQYGYLMVERNSVTLPDMSRERDDTGGDLITQMAEQSFAYSNMKVKIETEEKGILVYRHPDGRHDDKLWAMLMALYATRNLTTR